MPAASSTVTNISVTVTAIATANELSGVVPPFDHGLLDLDRLAHRVQHLVGEVEVLARELGEADHLVELRALGRVRRQVGARLAQDALRVLEPEHVEVAAQERELAARADQARGSRAPPA